MEKKELIKLYLQNVDKMFGYANMNAYIDERLKKYTKYCQSKKPEEQIIIWLKLLGHELRVSVYSTEEAGNKLPTGTEIIYLGWIMAGKIQRFGLARKKYKICAVCAVGMGQTGTQRKEIREKNNIPGKIPVFTL